MIQKLEHLDTRVVTTQSSIDFPSSSRPVYEIFSNLEHLILFNEEADGADDEEFFMPSLDCKA